MLSIDSAVNVKSYWRRYPTS